jgi:hypothetical protein
MLAKRLARHGVAVAGAALAVVLSQTASASASVPASVVSATVQAIAGQAVPAKVAALTEGVIKTMLVTKLTAMLAATLAAVVIGMGAALFSSAMAAAENDGKQKVHVAGQHAPPDAAKPADNAPAAAEQEQADKHRPGPEKAAGPTGEPKEMAIAWGKSVGSLQAGLGIRPGQRIYHYGEPVTLVVRVRNVSKETVKFEYIRQFLDENPPTVTADGKQIPQSGVDVLGFHFPVAVSLAPGKEIELESRMAGGPDRAGAPGYRYELGPVNGGRKAMTNEHLLRVGTGKVSLQYEQVIGNSSSGRVELDPVLSKLATGKLELQVQDAENPDKESTAWGKAVGGLQAGLSLRPERGVYRHGQTVTLVVRVRNIGKEAANFQYLKEYFIEASAKVTDDKGEPVPRVDLGSLVPPDQQRELYRKKARAGNPVPARRSLGPGKEVELCEVKLKLRSGNVIYPDTLAASGKVTVQYERLASPEIDGTLSTLATGTLALEIEPAATKKD